MPAHTALTRHHADVVTRKDLSELVKFSDDDALAVSFYFSLVSTPDNSHHQEVIAIKRLIQMAKDRLRDGSVPSSLARDLDDLLVAAEEVRLNPARFRAIFACHGRHVWKEFDLPVPRSVSHLDVGRRFVVLPLLAAAQSCAPYCVVLLETGKARTFVVRGTEIHEAEDRLPVEDLSLHAEDSRVGWSRHIDKGLKQHEKAYFKRLSHDLREFMTEQQIPHVVVGCREDLWGEIGVEFGLLPTGALLGHFHLPNFAIGAADVLRMATPVFQEGQKQRSVDLLREINETPSRSAFGVSDVLRALREGRALKLALGQLPNQTISECQDCGGMWAEAACNCIQCGSAKSRYLAAEEGLIRQALRADTEILVVEPGTAPGFSGAAALLRY